MTDQALRELVLGGLFVLTAACLMVTMLFLLRALVMLRAVMELLRQTVSSIRVGIEFLPPPGHSIMTSETPPPRQQGRPH